MQCQRGGVTCIIQNLKVRHQFLLGKCPSKRRCVPPEPMWKGAPCRIRLVSRRVRYGMTASPTPAENILCISWLGVSIKVSLVAGVPLPPRRRLVVANWTATLWMASLLQARCRRLYRPHTLPPRVARDPRLTGAFACTGGVPFAIIRILSPVLCAAFPIRMMVTAIGGRGVAGAEFTSRHHFVAWDLPPAPNLTWWAVATRVLLSRRSFGCAFGLTRVFDVWVCHRSHCV